MIPLPVVTESVEDGSFQCLFFCIALFSPKGKIIMKCETPKTWKANLFTYFYTKRLLAGCPYCQWF